LNPRSLKVSQVNEAFRWRNRRRKITLASPSEASTRLRAPQFGKRISSRSESDSRPAALGSLPKGFRFVNAITKRFSKSKLVQLRTHCFPNGGTGEVEDI
jgi:hypothetical protein